MLVGRPEELEPEVAKHPPRRSRSSPPATSSDRATSPPPLFGRSPARRWSPPAGLSATAPPRRSSPRARRERCWPPRCSRSAAVAASPAPASARRCLPGAPCVLIDAGATVDARPKHLLQSARWGRSSCVTSWRSSTPAWACSRSARRRARGTRSRSRRTACSRPPRSPLRRELRGPRRALRPFHVVVTDGFAGNVLLKALEGAAVRCSRRCGGPPSTSPRAKLGGLLLRPALPGYATAPTRRHTAAPTCWGCAGSP